MSEPTRRRVRQRAGANPTPPTDPTRVILRRRRCRRPEPTRFGRGRHWRAVALIVLTLLGAKPMWAVSGAIVERCRQGIAVVVEPVRRQFAWAGINHPQAAPSRPFAPGTPPARDGGTGTFASAFAAVWGNRNASGASHANAPAPAASFNASAHGGTVAAYPAMASWAAAGRAMPAHFAGHADRRSSVAAADAPAPSQTPAPDALPRANPVFTWNALAAATATPGTSSTYWTDTANWDGGTAPAPAANADIQFRTAFLNRTTSSTVDQNYTIHSLTFLSTATVYTLGGSNGVSLTINDGGITQGSVNAQTLTLPIVLGAAQTWNVATGAGVLAVNGVVSGANGFTKTGGGNLTLGGASANTFTGPTSVTGGTLELNKSSGAVAVPGDLSIGNAASPGAAGSVVARLDTNFQTSANGNLTLYADGLYDFSDHTEFVKSVTMTGGEVRAGSGTLYLVGDVTTNASATSALFSSTTRIGNVGLQGNMHAFNVADGAATYDLDMQAGITNGFLTKTGAGVMRLTGAANANFIVTLNAGTLALGSDTALGGPGNTFTWAGGTVTADGGARTIANAISLTGDAAVGDSLDGTPRAISFTGNTTLNGNRTLTVNNTAATTFGGAVNLGANTLTVGGPGSTLVSGVVGGSGGLTKQGTGTLTLTANNTYAGDTAIAGGGIFVNNVPAKPGDAGTGTGTVFVGPGAWLGGTGSIGGNVAVGVSGTFTPPPTVGAGGARFVPASGVLTPGVNGPGILTINGSLTFASSGTLEADLAGADPGTGYDQVEVGGNLSLAGNLTLTLAAGTPLAVGEKFYLFDLTSTVGVVTGTFENGAAGGVFVDNAGDRFQIKYNDTNPADGDAAANDVSLTVLPAPEPGTWVMCGLGAVAMAAKQFRDRHRRCRS